MMRAIHKLLPLGLILIVTLLLSGAGYTATYQEARAAYDRSEFLLAKTLWRALADGGDLEAMFALGAVLYEGPGEVAVNYLQSSQWYARAADLGHADAQYNLGNAYQRGLGVWQDDQQAVHWWRKAAEQGLPKAAYNLGVQYAYGRGVPQSREQALDWFSLAADKGHLQARQLLAGLSGQNDSAIVIQDSPEALEPAPLSQPIAEKARANSAVAESVVNDSAALTDPMVLMPEDSLDVFGVGERRLMSTKPASFTLQLTVMSSAQRLQDYIQIHDLAGELIRFRFMAADRTLFGLSQGVYPSREAGEAALEQLHQRHAHQQGWQTPWLRPTDGLKVLIRQITQTAPSNRG